MSRVAPPACEIASSPQAIFRARTTSHPGRLNFEFRTQCARALYSVWRTGHQHASGVEKGLPRNKSRPKTLRVGQDKHDFSIRILHSVVVIVLFFRNYDSAFQ